MRLTQEQEKNLPCNAALQRARDHVALAHGASPEDYRSDVMGWHRQHAPDCGFTPWKRASA